jgi:hypothetical protein
MGDAEFTDVLGLGWRNDGIAALRAWHPIPTTISLRSHDGNPSIVSAVLIAYGNEVVVSIIGSTLAISFPIIGLQLLL